MARDSVKAGRYLCPREKAKGKKLANIEKLKRELLRYEMQ
jgi:hypothetical protein